MRTDLQLLRKQLLDLRTDVNNGILEPGMESTYIQQERLFLTTADRNTNVLLSGHASVLRARDDYAARVDSLIAQPHLHHRTMTMRSLLVLLLMTLGLCASAQATDEQLAAQYMQAGDFERAAFYYSKLYDKQPTPFNYDQLFRCQLALKSYEEAAKLAKDQGRRQNNDPRYLVDLGVVLKLQGQKDKAEQQFDKAMKNMREDQNGVRSLANAFQKNDELDRALAVYQRGQKALRTDDFAFHYEIAQLYAAKGDIPAMISAYMDLIGSNPSYLQSVQNGLARYIDFTKQDERTAMLRTELLRHAQKDPDNTIFQEMLIWQYLQQKDLTGAFVQSKAMDKRFNEGGRRLMELAEIAVTNKEWSTATKCYQYVLDHGQAGRLLREGPHGAGAGHGRADHRAGRAAEGRTR